MSFPINKLNSGDGIYPSHPLTHLYYFNNQKLLIAVLKPGAPISYEHTLSNYAQIEAVTNKDAIRILFDIRHLAFENVPKEVLSCMAKNPYIKPHQKFAIFYEGLAQKIIAEMYIRLFKPHTPTLSFNSIESAFKWLDINDYQQYLKQVDFTL